VATLVGHLLHSLRDPSYRLAHYTHLMDGLNYLMVSDADLILAGPAPADVDQLQAVRKLSAAFPEIPVLALVDRCGEESGYLLKDAGCTDYLELSQPSGPLWSRIFQHCWQENDLRRDLARASAQVDWMQHTDSLTDLLNRKGIERATLQRISEVRPLKRDLQILLIDLDDFVRINTTLGHGVGDLVLMAAGRCIKEMTGPDDLVGRVGTDRFAVVLEGESENEAADTAERIRLAIGRDAIQAGDHLLSTTASIGVTGVPTSVISFDEILAQAHFVLQRSKLKGKNRVTRAASADEVKMFRPDAVGHDMTRALLRGNVLQAFSQPIVNLLDGRIVSQEMLIRGPEGPLRSPDALFRYCQEKDILASVDLRCLKMCARVARTSAINGAARYHVNIMPATLLQTPVDELIRVLQVDSEYGHCCLELSEQQLLGDPAVLLPRVRTLQEAGIRLAIDDVGYGKSHLENLVMLDPQIMKLDKRLIQGVSGDSEMRRTLGRMLKLADVLGSEVVAEGIEDAEDYRVLLEMGVRLGQGYLFGVPKACRMPEEKGAPQGYRAQA